MLNIAVVRCLIICHSDYYYSIGVGIVQFAGLGYKNANSLMDKYAA